MQVRDLMTVELVTIGEHESLNLADEMMKLARVRQLPVIEDQQLVGLLTQKDLMRAQVSSIADLEEDESKEINQTIPVGAAMSTDVMTIGPDEPALEAAERLKAHKVGCLPVVDNENLVGMITETDFLQLVIKALRQNTKAETTKAVHS
ncbi:MAG: CBS domain-containing protein [Myxococcota bacterium]|nr:CBS domain-containing protein [Myxococcota bacterium]